MKILHYIPSIDRESGGVGSYIQLLARSLGGMAELHIATHSSENELRLENCQIHYIDHWMHYFCLKKQWQNLLEQINPDVIHVNCCWQPESAMVQMWSYGRGYKTVYSPHGMLEPWDIKKNYWTKKLPALILYQKKAIQVANCLVATSDVEKNNLLQLGYNSKVYVIPNGVVIEEIKIKHSWKLRKQIFFLALLRKNKGADFLIQAVAKIRNKLDGYKIVIAGTIGYGEETYVEYLHNLVDKYKLGDMIEFPGGLYGENKWKYYQESDLFVLPTLNENFGIVIAESLLSGTPVITCKGAPWPQLETEGCGWWVDRNVDSLVNAILEGISKSPEELEHMGKIGRAYVENNYSALTIANKYLEMYNSLYND